MNGIKTDIGRLKLMSDKGPTITNARDGGAFSTTNLILRVRA